MAKSKGSKTGGQNTRAKGTKFVTGGASTVRLGSASKINGKGTGTKVTT